MVTSKSTGRHSRINQGCLVLSFRKVLMKVLLKTSDFVEACSFLGTGEERAGYEDKMFFFGGKM